MCDNGAFNNDRYVQQEIVGLVNKYKINNFIESGTFRGQTTFFMAKYVNIVISVEIQKNLYLETSKKNIYNNVLLINGNSVEEFDKIMPEIKNDNNLFYLDAHWFYWPLLDELNIISKYCKDKAIIVIDDFQVPGRDYIKYDTYGGIKNNFQYIQKSLDNIYPNGYVYYYNDKVENIDANSGRIYILPKKLDDKSLYYTENGINYSNINI
jgi:hypothetical protein